MPPLIGKAFADKGGVFGIHSYLSAIIGGLIRRAHIELKSQIGYARDDEREIKKELRAWGNRCE